jgi:L-alanine-DL-glutamate epimerase-like enolase superfamily enzyme
MGRVLLAEAERFPIAGTFTISRGSKTEAEVITCTISDGDATGRGECVPYRRYGETPDSVMAQIEVARRAVEDGWGRIQLAGLLPPGAARNALDCALWDLEAKLSGTPVAERLCPNGARALVTAYTLSLGSPEVMARQAHDNRERPVLKIKIGTDDDESRIRAVAAAAPRSRLILDANEGWTPGNLAANLALAAELGVALIEQPLPAGEDGALRGIARPVPICADESVHTADDLGSLVGLYDAVNIKLDKAGGLTEALRLRDQARALGLGVMVGCMVGTSLAMAPAVLLAQDADYVDLDGPLLLARDRAAALTYRGSEVSPPTPDLWG